MQGENQSSFSRHKEDQVVAFGILIVFARMKSYHEGTAHMRLRALSGRALALSSRLQLTHASDPEGSAYQRSIRV